MLRFRSFSMVVKGVQGEENGRNEQGCCFTLFPETVAT